MDFFAEAQIARELMKFASNGTLYRGSKPVMWSVVEKTALAEAEVEYEDYTSDTVWVKFPVTGYNVSGSFLLDMNASLVGSPKGKTMLREVERLSKRAVCVMPALLSGRQLLGQYREIEQLAIRRGLVTVFTRSRMHLQTIGRKSETSSYWPRSSLLMCCAKRE